MTHIWASFRAWWNRAWLPDALGCFRALQYQLSSTITCQKEKERQSQNLGKSVTLSRDNQCKLPYLIGWLDARSARRNFCLTITSNSWMVKVSQYINVWVFLVCVWLYACTRGCLGAVTLLLFFVSFLFSGPFCFLSFHKIHIYIFIFSFFCFFFFHFVHFFHFFHFFIFSFFSSIFSLFSFFFLSFCLKSRAQRPPPLFLRR